MSQPPTVTDSPVPNRPATPSPASQGEAVDPILRLHKMSTTAGVGSQEYVAVNAPAVFAMIFGLASALALLDRVLLLIPVLGLACAILAFYQIARSGGTQTGRWLAVAGIVLSFSFAGYTFGREFMARSQQARDRVEIDALVAQFGTLLSEGKFDQAHALTSQRFRDRVAAPLFALRLKYVQDGRTFGLTNTKISGARTNGLYEFQKDPESGRRMAAVTMLFDFPGAAQPGRESARFINAGQGWEIDDLTQLFPARQQPSAAPPG